REISARSGLELSNSPSRALALKMRRLAFALVWSLVVLPLFARGCEKLTGCEYHEGSHSDGDSIEILRDGKRYIFRLYFVDCVERNPDSRARRVAAARHFWLAERAEKS